MKTFILKSATLLTLSLLLSSCAVDMFNRISGNRNVVTENRKLNNNFSAVKVSTGLDLYITQGDRVSLVVEADENLQDIIKTEVKDGRLKIYSEKNIWKAKARKVHLTITDIDELVATSGSDVVSKNTLQLKNLKVSVNSGADARISVEGETVESSASSGADLILSGNTVNHTAKASSGSSIKAYKLKSKHVIVKASSGADIDVHASESINAKANSGGDVDYIGNPEKVSQKESSGGDVTRK